MKEEECRLFDSHAHYDDEAFDEDRDQVLSGLAGRGVTHVVNPGCTVSSSRAAAALAERYGHVYAAAGIHPENCAGAGEEDFEQIRALLRHPKVVAVGEIGLDYYWKENPPREFQRQVFRRQLALAEEAGLPVIVHDRDAHGDALAIVREFPRVRGVFHCYSGSLEDARELVKAGWYLGFNGAITFQNARKAPEVVTWAPLERILIETDCPYLTPVPFRGRRNDSGYLPYVAEKIAGWKGLTVEAVEEATTRNAKKFYGIE
ncbi:TatD family hydrolase [Oscillibacter hominis]|uniref:TatD family hydrolase n=1 Tax=Oscillibacter hominis TaxID=2763056 RepID=UPI001FAE186B|nr:TatD family hydrolase [Oscillibacter hominis]